MYSDARLITMSNNNNCILYFLLITNQGIQFDTTLFFFFLHLPAKRLVCGERDRMHMTYIAAWLQLRNMTYQWKISNVVYCKGQNQAALWLLRKVLILQNLYLYGKLQGCRDDWKQIDLSSRLGNPPLFLSLPAP